MYLCFGCFLQSQRGEWAGAVLPFFYYDVALRLVLAPCFGVLRFAAQCRSELNSTHDVQRAASGWRDEKLDEEFLRYDLRAVLRDSEKIVITRGNRGDSWKILSNFNQFTFLSPTFFA